VRRQSEASTAFRSGWQHCAGTENTCWTDSSEGGTRNQSVVDALLCRRTPKLDQPVDECFGDCF